MRLAAGEISDAGLRNQASGLAGLLHKTAEDAMVGVSCMEPVWPGYWSSCVIYRRCRMHCRFECSEPSTGSTVWRSVIPTQQSNIIAGRTGNVHAYAISMRDPNSNSQLPAD